jgi:hypothetical protein
MMLGSDELVGDVFLGAGQVVCIHHSGRPLRVT